MNNRRQSRETVFALLFEWSFNQEKKISEILDNAADSRDISIDKFSENLLNMTIDNIEEIDGKIEKYSESWKINRISSVCLSCLRMALAEIMFFDDIPVGATINESVEIAKKYGSEEEPAFVNGLLGNYTRSNQTKEND